MTEKELLRLKEEIDEAKEKFLQFKGQREALIQQLKDNWGCSSIEDANKLLSEMSEEVESINSEIIDGITKLEQQYLKNGLD